MPVAATIGVQRSPVHIGRSEMRTVKAVAVGPRVDAAPQALSASTRPKTCTKVGWPVVEAVQRPCWHALVGIVVQAGAAAPTLVQSEYPVASATAGKVHFTVVPSGSFTPSSESGL